MREEKYVTLVHVCGIIDELKSGIFIQKSLPRTRREQITVMRDAITIDWFSESLEHFF